MSAPTPMTLQSTPTYKMAVARLAFHAVATVSGAILAALTGVKWVTLDGQSRFLLVLGIVATVSSTASAYCDKTMARLGDGKAALPTGDTSAPFANQPSKTLNP